MEGIVPESISPENKQELTYLAKRAASARKLLSNIRPVITQYKEICEILEQSGVSSEGSISENSYGES